MDTKPEFKTVRRTSYLNSQANISKATTASNSLKSSDASANSNKSLGGHVHMTTTCNDFFCSPCLTSNNGISKLAGPITATFKVQSCKHSLKTLVNLMAISSRITASRQ